MSVDLVSATAQRVLISYQTETPGTDLEAFSGLKQIYYKQNHSVMSTANV